MLACGAAFLYGLNDVVAEYYVKSPSCDPEEYLGMLGLFGSLLSFGLQVPIMEYDQLSEMIAKAKVVPWNELIVAILLDFLLAFPAFSTVFTTSYSTFYPNSKPQF